MPAYLAIRWMIFVNQFQLSPRVGVIHRPCSHTIYCLGLCKSSCNENLCKAYVCLRIANTWFCQLNIVVVIPRKLSYKLGILATDCSYFDPSVGMAVCCLVAIGNGGSDGSCLISEGLQLKKLNRHVLKLGLCGGLQEWEPLTSRLPEVACQTLGFPHHGE